MKHILITGASNTSVTGRSIANVLKGRYRLSCPSRAEMDLSDQNSVDRFMQQAAPDIVIHCATHTSASSLAECEDNLRMYFNLTAHLKYLEKMVYFGSGAEFDKKNDVSEATEAQIGEHIPHDSYGFSKLVETLFARKSDKIINLRLFGMINPMEDYNRNFISNLCAKAVLGLPLTVRKECRFSYLDIEDLCKFVIWAIDHNPHYQDYNTCNNQYYNLTELAALVKNISGRDLSIKILNQGHAPAYTGDGTRLLDESRIICRNVSESIASLYHYFDGIKDRFDRTLVERAV